MAANAMNVPRFYRTKQQGVIGWIAAVVTAGGSVVVLVSSTARHHGGYVLAPMGVVLAAGMIRFALCGVLVTLDGVRVRNMFTTTVLAWEQIKEFRLSQFGACQIALKNGKWVAIDGIEQTNIAGLTHRQDTRERGMIDELNALRHEHTGGAATTAPPTRQRGTQGS
jgi:Bacterial PH domain